MLFVFLFMFGLFLLKLKTTLRNGDVVMLYDILSKFINPCLKFFIFNMRHKQFFSSFSFFMNKWNSTIIFLFVKKFVVFVAYFFFKYAYVKWKNTILLHKMALLSKALQYKIQYLEILICVYFSSLLVFQKSYSTSNKPLYN